MFIFSAKNFRLYLSGLLFALAVISTAAAIAIPALRSRVSAVSATPSGEEAICRSFLVSMGWSPSALPAEESVVTVPAEFNEVYAAYNALQLAQGFDLTPLRGKPVKKYVFVLDSYPGLPAEHSVRATVLTYKGEIAGGDIASVRLDGFMHGFSYETVDYEFYPT